MNDLLKIFDVTMTYLPILFLCSSPTMIYFALFTEEEGEAFGLLGYFLFRLLKCKKRINVR